jgi:hypothetical protein
MQFRGMASLKRKKLQLKLTPISLSFQRLKSTRNLFQKVAHKPTKQDSLLVP